jgi:hypothetical protein
MLWFGKQVQSTNIDRHSSKSAELASKSPFVLMRTVTKVYNIYLQKYKIYSDIYQSFWKLNFKSLAIAIHGIFDVKLHLIYKSNVVLKKFFYLLEHT